MLNLQFARAWVELTIDRSRFDREIFAIEMTLARITRRPWRVTLALDGGPFLAAMSILQQRVDAFRNSMRSPARMRVNAVVTTGVRDVSTGPRIPGVRDGIPGVRGGMLGGLTGGAGFASGLWTGAGLPFAASPSMMAGEAVAGSVRKAVGVAMDLETKLAELRRITGFTPETGQRFKGQLLDLAGQHGGAPAGDLFEMATAGGRSGITDPGALLEFTRALARVKTAVNDIPTDQLAADMLKIINVFGLGTDRVEGLGSALTAMDNISTATAQDILTVTQSISGTAAAIRLSVPQVMALASVIKDVGLQNATAATSFSQIFRLMASNAENFGNRIGLSGKAFADVYRKDPMDALGLVIKRFNEFKDTVSGQEFLVSLGLRGQRTAGSLQQLAQRFDKVAERAKIASQETGSLTSLNAAVTIQSDTTAKAIERLNGAMTKLADTLGSKLLPKLADWAEGIAGLTKGLVGSAEGKAGQPGQPMPGFAGRLEAEFRRMAFDSLVNPIGTFLGQVGVIPGQSYGNTKDLATDFQRILYGGNPDEQKPPVPGRGLAPLPAVSPAGQGMVGPPAPPKPFEHVGPMWLDQLNASLNPEAPGPAGPGGKKGAAGEEGEAAAMPELVDRLNRQIPKVLADLGMTARDIMERALQAGDFELANRMRRVDVAERVSRQQDRLAARDVIGGQPQIGKIGEGALDKFIKSIPKPEERDAKIGESMMDIGHRIQEEILGMDIQRQQLEEQRRISAGIDRLNTELMKAGPAGDSTLS